VEHNLKRIYGFGDLFRFITLSPEITEEYVSVKVYLRKAGNIIDDFDILIGATALVHGLTIVTNNEDHFSRIKNIKIENWLA